MLIIRIVNFIHKCKEIQSPSHIYIIFNVVMIIVVLITIIVLIIMIIVVITMMIFIINIKTWVPAQRESALQSHRGSYLLSQAPESGIIIHGDNCGRDNYWADNVVIILPELYSREVGLLSWLTLLKITIFYQSYTEERWNYQRNWWSYWSRWQLLPELYRTEGPGQTLLNRAKTLHTWNIICQWQYDSI